MRTVSDSAVRTHDFAFRQRIAQHNAIDLLQVQSGNLELARRAAPRPGGQNMQHVGNRARHQAIAAVAAAIEQSRNRLSRGRDPNEVVARLLHRERKVRIFVDVVVVDEVQLGAVLVENGDRAVEARTGAGRHHIENQRLARFGMEAEHVVVIVSPPRRRSSPAA